MLRRTLLFSVPALRLSCRCPLSQILGNNECFEPYTSNIYVRRVLSGEFTVVNQHLLQDLTRLGLWDRDLKNELVNANGSVQARTHAGRAVTANHQARVPVLQSSVWNMN